LKLIGHKGTASRRALASGSMVSMDPFFIADSNLKPLDLHLTLSHNRFAMDRSGCDTAAMVLQPGNAMINH
jgi:hypothetical protein